MSMAQTASQLTPEAAAETGKRLLHGAAEAKLQHEQGTTSETEGQGREPE